MTYGAAVGLDGAFSKTLALSPSRVASGGRCDRLVLMYIYYYALGNFDLGRVMRR